MSWLPWMLILALSCPTVALAHPGGEASQEVCRYGRRVAPELTAAIRADADRDARHRRNPLAVVKRAERRAAQSAEMEALLAGCSVHDLGVPELRWMHDVVEEALSHPALRRDTPSGARLRMLRALLREAILG